MDQTTEIIKLSDRTENRVSGKRHRLDGPAVIYADGDEEYWVNGQLHRTDGPAVDRNDRREYWIRGVQYIPYDNDSCYINGVRYISIE